MPEKAATKHRLEVESQHDKAFEERPSTQAKRKGEGEVKALVGEVQRLRSEHDKLMKKLHAKEVGIDPTFLILCLVLFMAQTSMPSWIQAQEIRAFEEEAAGKIQEQASPQVDLISACCIDIASGNMTGDLLVFETSPSYILSTLPFPQSNQYRKSV